MKINREATVFVVDDDPSVRKGLSRLLKSQGYIVETFASAKDFLVSDKKSKRQVCLILDLQMPGMKGLDLQDELISQNLILPIIFLTGHGDIPSSVRAIKKGAVNFLSKPVDDEMLFDTIEEAIAKGAKEMAISKEKDCLQIRLDTLTPREHEVMTHVIAGQLNKRTADVLNIAEKTVKVHRARIMVKMGVYSAAQLVWLAQKTGIQPARD